MGVEEISRKYDIDTKTLEKVLKAYGSLEKFKEIYVRALIDNNTEEIYIPKELNGRLIKYFDLSEPDGIGRENAYLNFVNAIFEQQNGYIFETPIKRFVQSAMRTLYSKKQEMIRMRYGLDDGRAKFLKEIGELYGVSKESIRTQVDRILEQLRKSNIKERFYSNLLFDRKQVIAEFFAEHDIFFNYDIMDLKLKSELGYIILKSKIENLDYNFTFNKTISDIDRSISSDFELDEEHKIDLQKRFKYKVDFIVEKYNVRKITEIEQKLEIEEPTSLELLVEELNISQRTYNCLKREGFNTVKDIVNNTRSGIMGIKNLGEKSFNEIIEVLNLLGFVVPVEKNGKIFYVR